MQFDLNLKQLKVFYYVGKHLSFTKAAEQLYVTQPAVAMQMKALERYCETSLFVRVNNRLELTEAGKTLYSYAERIVTLAYEAEQAVAGLREEPETILRLGTTKTWARYLMPAYILTFQKAQPDIHILLDDGSSDEMAASVLSGRCDLAIVGRIPYDPALESIPFPGHEVDELKLVVNPSHPLAGRDAVSLREVAGEDFILRQKGSGTRQAIDDRARRMGLALHVLLEAGSPEFIKDLVKKNVGVSILTQLSVEEEVRKGNLKSLSFIEGRLYLSLDILRLRDSVPGPAASAFLGFLEQQKAASAAGSIPLTVDS